MNCVTLETVANIAAILGKPESVIPTEQEDDGGRGVLMRFCWTEIGEQCLAVLTVKPQDDDGWACSLAINMAEGGDDPTNLSKLHEVIGWCVSNQARCLLDNGDNFQQAVATVVPHENDQDAQPAMGTKTSGCAHPVDGAPANRPIQG